jgi:5-deoxy-glucuronate isomerase
VAHLSELLVRATETQGHGAHHGEVAMVDLRAAASRAGERWEHVGFWEGTLPRGGTLPLRWKEPRESCLVILGGRGTVECDGARWEVGGRADAFDGPASALYLPPGTDATLTAITDVVEIAIGVARGDGASARLLEASRMRREVRGSGAMERTIRHILMEDQPASSLLVTEVVTPAGHWSSYPPHKHDTDDPPRERKLEEIYYFRFRDPRAFGLMRVYTADRSLDETIAVRDRDLVLVPRGYHTFSAAPGYDAYYLNVMAGPRREWKITFDPDHERMRW